MPDQAEDDQPRRKPMPAHIPEPHEAFYTRTDPAENRLLTTLSLVSGALAETLEPLPRLPIPVQYAQPEECERPAIFHDPGDLIRLLRQIIAWIATDARHRELLSELYQTLDGDLLWILCHNLFRERKPKKALNAKGKPILTQREVEVLQAAAGDLSHQEIAQKLHIEAGVVNNHLTRIYRKLFNEPAGKEAGADSRPLATGKRTGRKNASDTNGRGHNKKKTLKAVAMAISMGYLELDTLDWMVRASHCTSRNFGTFASWLSCLRGTQPEFTKFGLDALAEFGLLLLILSGATPTPLVNATHWDAQAEGRICQLNARGEVVRAFGTGMSGTVRATVQAPPQAARHGFTPGNLFVAVYHPPAHGLNTDVILEMTPEGQVVRAFTGGEEFGSSLAVVSSLVFTSDGRLLVSTMHTPDAILEFRDGGRTVRRFADICAPQVCIGPTGDVYAVQYSSIGCTIKVFDESGQLLQTLSGGKSNLPNLSGIAVNDQGVIYVGRYEEPRWYIDVLNSEGACLRSFLGSGESFARLAVDAQDRLYVCCVHCDVHIYSPEGTLLQHIDMKNYLQPLNIAQGNDGTLWVCGAAP